MKEIWLVEELREFEDVGVWALVQVFQTETIADELLRILRGTKNVHGPVQFRKRKVKIFGAKKEVRDYWTRGV